MFMERVLMLYSSHKNENENFARNRLLTAKSKDAHIVMFFAELFSHIAVYNSFFPTESVFIILSENMLQYKYQAYFNNFRRDIG